MISSADEPRERTHDGFSDGSDRLPDQGTGPGSEAANSASAAENPLEPLVRQIAAVRKSAIHYFDAQKDTAQAAIRGLIIKAFIGTVAAIVGVSALAACTVMLTGALAEMVSMATGGRPWVGKLIVGGGLLIATAIAIGAYISSWVRSARANTIRKYEGRQYAQRREFGTGARQHSEPSERTV